MRVNRNLWAFATLVAATVAGCGSDGGGTVDAPVGEDMAIDGAPDASDAPSGPLTFHCGLSDPQCPSITIAGDPVSTDIFRGYGDPSLEKDPSGALWLTYSWLENETIPGNPAVLNTVRTHLARSDDGGATFTHVRALNATAPAPGNVALVMHEVSTIARRADATWEAAWLTYAMFPNSSRGEFHYQHTTAAAPTGLGDTTTAWIRGSASTVATELQTANIQGITNCIALTEPALHTQAGVTYLVTTCIVDGTPATQRLVVLRESGANLVYVGDLLSYADAVALGATRLEQIDLSVGVDGQLLAIVTPIDDTAAVIHRGCVVLEVADLTTATMRRAGDGQLVKRAVITADGNSIGPGLCTYDRDSSTGVLLVITNLTSSSLTFSLHATGVRP